MSFFAELRRRNVIRVAGLYLVGAWLVVQVAETLLPIFDTPGWVLKALVALLAIAFVPALLFAWAFELTPEGLKRERDVDRSQSAVDQTARKLDIAVIVLLLGVGGLMLWNRWAPAPSAAPAADSAAAPAATRDPAMPAPTAAPTDKSIAVLPFADFSAGGDQAWFADGLSEEILNSLARTPDLLVAARTSSFRYKGSTLSVPEIAAELGVANVLEGSVRSTPDRIRVTAQLIRAADGFHLWSQTYDRDVSDVIAIQEDLAKQIAVAMQTTMDPEALADMSRVGTASVEAYQAYVRGLARDASSGSADSAEQAYALFEQARALDPGFAAAHAAAAQFWANRMAPNKTFARDTGATLAEMQHDFQERIDLALRNAPNPVERRGYEALKAFRELRLRDAIALYQQHLVERPGDMAAMGRLVEAATLASEAQILEDLIVRLAPLSQSNLDAATTLANYSHRTGNFERGAEHALALAQRWPEDGAILYQAHRALLWDGQVEAAAAMLARWRSTDVSGFRAFDLPDARQACAEGRRADVERALAELPEDDVAGRWHLLGMLGREEEAAEALRPLETQGNLFGLASFLNYPQFDPRPYPSLMALMAREKIDRPPPVPLPFACPPAGAAAP